MKHHIQTWIASLWSSAYHIVVWIENNILWLPSKRKDNNSVLLLAGGMATKLCTKHPSLVSRKGSILLHDGVKLNGAILTQKVIKRTKFSLILHICYVYPLQDSAHFGFWIIFVESISMMKTVSKAQFLSSSTLVHSISVQEKFYYLWQKCIQASGGIFWQVNLLSIWFTISCFKTIWKHRKNLWNNLLPK